MNISIVNNMSRDVWEMILENLDMCADDMRGDRSSMIPGSPVSIAPHEAKQEAHSPCVTEPAEHAESNTTE